MTNSTVSRSFITASTIDLDDLATRVQQLSSRCHARSLSLDGAAQLLPQEWHARTHAIAVQVAQISRDLQGVGSGLQSTSEAYAWRESFLAAVTPEASSTMFWGLGRLFALMAPAAIPAVIGGVAAVMATWTLTGKRPEELLSSPVFVASAGYVVSGIDDFGAGILGIPRPVMAAIGEQGLGLSGPSTLAAGILLLAGAGFGAGAGAAVGSGVGAGLRVRAETPVTVSRVSTAAAEAPHGIEDLVGRIPRANPEMAQVRIERYEGAPGENATFIVYVGGTIDTALRATDEPWDMTSNLAALAALDAGSYRAAVLAMQEAGIASNDLVTLVGHSQGGLLAARIAQSEEFRVGDVVTVGAPIHQIEIPAGVTVTAIEHNEDLVPTLGGLPVAGTLLGGTALVWNASAISGATACGTTTTVRRSALTGMAPNAGDALPGHNLSRYVETGRVMDDSTDPQLISLRARLETHAQGAAEVSLWRGERLAR